MWRPLWVLGAALIIFYNFVFLVVGCFVDLSTITVLGECGSELQKLSSGLGAALSQYVGDRWPT